MGNISTNSFKKDMSDSDFTKALVEVCRDRFGDFVRVSHNCVNGEICSWVVGPPEELVTDDKLWCFQWEIFRETKRKFGGKHPRSDWGQWMMYVVQNELAFRHNGRISDEGVQGTWKGDPTKESIASFRAWIQTRWEGCFEPGSPEIEQWVTRGMQRAPEALRNL